MDFGQLGFDAFFSSTSASNNGGFGFLKQERDSKMAKLSSSSSSNSETMLRFPLQRCNGGSEMLSFSSPNSQAVTLPFYHHTSAAFGRSSGGPFTASQWMELEHQALIYKYITANVPIPCYLLNPIRKAFESAGFRSNAFGWGGFHLGFSNTDPEPGRCRRTDGKKWRCSRDAVADQKYCERHMNRGRHRSRKPVEAQSSAAAVGKTVPASNFHPGIPTNTRNPSVVDTQKQQNPAFQEASFGSVCSDSLLNPLNSPSTYRQFMDDWPKTQLSISIPMVSSDFMSSTSSPTNQKLTSSPPRFSQDLEMGLGVGDRTQREASWVPISWEPSMGGPLGEVLQTGECRTSKKPLNLIDSWDNSPRLASSPTGVLQRGAFGTSLSNSSAASSPRADPGLMNPSLPAL